MRLYIHNLPVIILLKPNSNLNLINSIYLMKNEEIFYLSKIVKVVDETGSTEALYWAILLIVLTILDCLFFFLPSIIFPRVVVIGPYIGKYLVIMIFISADFLWLFKIWDILFFYLLIIIINTESFERNHRERNYGKRK